MSSGKRLVSDYCGDGDVEKSIISDKLKLGLMSEDKREEKSRHQQSRALIWFTANLMLQRDCHGNVAKSDFLLNSLSDPFKNGLTDS